MVWFIEVSNVDCIPLKQNHMFLFAWFFLMQICAGFITSCSKLFLFNVITSVCINKFYSFIDLCHTDLFIIAQLFCRCAYKPEHIVVHVKRSQPKPFCNGIITHKIIIQTSDTFILYVYTVYSSYLYNSIFL